MGAIISRDWGSTVWPESQLAYKIDIVLMTEFRLDRDARCRSDV